jgi:hypothetical protein
MHDVRFPHTTHDWLDFQGDWSCVKAANGMQSLRPISGTATHSHHVMTQPDQAVTKVSCLFRRTAEGSFD